MVDGVGSFMLKLIFFCFNFGLQTIETYFNRTCLFSFCEFKFHCRIHFLSLIVIAKQIYEGRLAILVHYFII